MLQLYFEKKYFYNFFDAMQILSKTKQRKRSKHFRYSFLNKGQILNVCKAEVLEQIHSFNVSEKY